MKVSKLSLEDYRQLQRRGTPSNIIRLRDILQDLKERVESVTEELNEALVAGYLVKYLPEPESPPAYDPKICCDRCKYCYEPNMFDGRFCKITHKEVVNYSTETCGRFKVKENLVTWSIKSKSDPRWNCSGKSSNWEDCLKQREDAFEKLRIKYRNIIPRDIKKVSRQH